MAKFNPDFWEVTIAPATWETFAKEDDLYHEDPEDILARQQRAEDAQALAPHIRRIIDQVLTPRQREVILLYFYRGLNQRQIADKLSIAQQVVSGHLYGQVRNGKAVGGALRKLRRECAKRGISYPSR